MDDAALVAFSGDTILVAPDNYALGRVILHSGVALLAEGPREDTRLEMADWEGDGLVLAADGPDTTLVAGFEMLFSSGENYEDGILVETPAAIVRGNLFLDLYGFGNGSTIRLLDGGIVERNQFLTGALNGIRVDGGQALIQYNTWNYDGCNMGNMVSMKFEREAGPTMIRNNTFDGGNLSFPRDVEVELVNNIFVGTQFSCPVTGTPAAVYLHHNLLWGVSALTCEPPDTLWGPGNIEWGYGPPGHILFCHTPGAFCYEMTIDSHSPVVGSGENGENLGAWPVACGPEPVGYDPDHPIPPMPSGVGFPAPNPSSGVLRLPIALQAGRQATVDVYDAAGRLVRALRAGPGSTNLRWDGIDARGTPVSPGAYCLRVRESGVTRTVRIVR